MRYFIGGLVLVGLYAVLGAWFFMLSIGAASNESQGVIPPLGYWASFFLFIALGIAANWSRSSN
jgi:hypothetical protein